MHLYTCIPFPKVSECNMGGCILPKQNGMKMIFTETVYTPLLSVSSFYDIKHGVENLRLADTKTRGFINIYDVIISLKYIHLLK